MKHTLVHSRIFCVNADTEPLSLIQIEEVYYLISQMQFAIVILNHGFRKKIILCVDGKQVRRRCCDMNQLKKKRSLHQNIRMEVFKRE